MLQVAYDIETYPNCFTLAAEDIDSPLRWGFEISDYRNDTEQLIHWMMWLRDEGARMVGFNNVGFDYPVMHLLLRSGTTVTPAILYQKAMSIIRSENRFEHMVYPSDRFVPQLDLYLIHHFDNKARATSLKALEFNMQMDNISDLPFPVGTRLNREQITMLREYNAHDVTATKQFYHQSLEQIGFREQLTRQYGRDFLNHNDTKIGAEIFQMELESAGVHCYEYGRSGRQPRQTHRPSIALKDCVPQWIRFEHPEFQRIKQFFEDTVITKTKGAFDITARVAGLDIIYGTGGLHASCDSEYFAANDDWMIYDVDVTSLYPSIAIEHGHYPEHLSPVFVEVYRKLRERRTSYPKGTPENAMLKLALNGVYGKSNDVFSIFYDPLFTMKITVSGQLLISLLVEWIVGYVPEVQIVQCNTDGVTVFMPRRSKDMMDKVCHQWEQTTKLRLEYVEYSKMVVRDVNNYLAITTTGKVKRKGAYEWKKEWHQDASALVIPKVAEQVLLHDAPLIQTLHEWHDIMDFMMRIKVPRGSRLELRIEDTIQPLENTQRYFVSKSGGQLVKIMPPLKGKTEWREFRQEAGWKVFPCNKLGSKLPRVDYDYYQQEIEKLTLGVM